MVGSKSSLPGLQMAAISISSHGGEREEIEIEMEKKSRGGRKGEEGGRERKREKMNTNAQALCCLSDLIMALIPFIRLHTHDLSMSQRSHLLIPSPWALGFNRELLGECKH